MALFSPSLLEWSRPGVLHIWPGMFMPRCTTYTERRFLCPLIIFHVNRVKGKRSLRVTSRNLRRAPNTAAGAASALANQRQLRLTGVQATILSLRLAKAGLRWLSCFALINSPHNVNVALFRPLPQYASPYRWNHDQDEKDHPWRPEGKHGPACHDPPLMGSVGKFRGLSTWRVSAFSHRCRLGQIFCRRFYSWKSALGTSQQASWKLECPIMFYLLPLVDNLKPGSGCRLAWHGVEER